MLNERSQSQKTTYDSIHMEFQNRKIYRKQISGCLGLGAVEGKMGRPGLGKVGYQLVFSREMKPIGCGYIEKDLRDLLMQLQKLISPKSEGWPTGWRSKMSSCCSSSSKARIPFCSRRGQSFALFRPSAGWMRPTHVMENNLLYSKSTYLNVNLI